MQAELFDFGLKDQILEIYNRLKRVVGTLPPATVREPIDTLVESIISSRTKDWQSLRAYEKLKARYPTWTEMMTAPEADIVAAIADVQFPEDKAKNLQLALRHIHAHHPDFDLHFLDSEPLPKVLAWYQALPGAGPKVAAAAVNFSTSNRDALVMDTHVLRVFTRLGLIGKRTSAEAAATLLAPALSGWAPEDLADLHAYMKKLGQEVCTANECLCRQCPLADMCASVWPRR